MSLDVWNAGTGTLSPGKLALLPHHELVWRENVCPVELVECDKMTVKQYGNDTGHTSLGSIGVPPLGNSALGTMR